MVARSTGINPILRITPLPYTDPLVTLQPFSQDPMVALLDSAAAGDARSRFSYIAIEPFSVIRADEKGVSIDGTLQTGNPFSLLQEVLADYQIDCNSSPVPFCGGAVGYLSYEMGRYADRFPPLKDDPYCVPEMVIGLYDCIIAYDHQNRASYLINNGFPEKDLHKRENRARMREAHILKRLECAISLPPLDWSLTAEWREEQTRAQTEKAIARVIDYILAGDIFQANLTQRRLATCPDGLDDFMLYRRLRALSPAPFSSFLRCGTDISVLSASPERFLRLDRHGCVETRPIKGTIRRDNDPTCDAALAAQLHSSIKDRAENLMIVDLMRNDLGRICEQGSVAVPALMELETFSSVHHLVSAVTGQLKPECDAIDLLRACFPGGSITGAPKIRAMEIITELEPHQRGVCFGSVVQIGFDGAMDSNIAIRTLVRNKKMLIAQAGGGIVADSLPAEEYDEALLKMRPLLQALTGPSS